MTTQKTTNPVATRTRAVDRSRAADPKQMVESARPQTAPTGDGVEAAPSAEQAGGIAAILAVPAATTPQPIAHAVPSDDLASPQPVTVPLTPAIDIVTGTIGGVGKTQFAHLLTSYYYDRMLKSGHLQPIHLVGDFQIMIDPAILAREPGSILIKVIPYAGTEQRTQSALHQNCPKAQGH